MSIANIAISTIAGLIGATTIQFYPPQGPYPPRYDPRYPGPGVQMPIPQPPRPRMEPRYRNDCYGQACVNEFHRWGGRDDYPRYDNQGYPRW